MGIYDRPYYREERSSWLSGRSLVVNLILVNVAVYVAEWLLGPRFTRTVSLTSDVFYEPWNLWQLVTYGFVHSEDIAHILFNMFGLWLFGTELEQIYGRAEFLRIYLAAIIIAGPPAWVGYETATHANGILQGASGGVMGLVFIFIFHFPKRIFYIWGILPLPAWALGGLYFLMDVAGVSQSDNVAHVAHLAGAAFGVVYFKTGMNLGRLVPRRLSDLRLRWRPRLRIHDPKDEGPALSEQVDQILEKISRQGEASLTKKERRTLEEASRRYQQRRQ